MADTMLWLTLAGVSACTVLWTVVPSPVGRMPRADVAELRRRRNLSRVLTDSHPGPQAPPRSTTAWSAPRTRPSGSSDCRPSGVCRVCGSEPYAPECQRPTDDQASETGSSATAHAER